MMQDFCAVIYVLDICMKTLVLVLEEFSSLSVVI